MIRAFRQFPAGLALPFALLLAAPAAAQDPGGVPIEQHACQRECFEDFVERYLQAMADGTVPDELFARDVRFTENGVELPLGNEGLWATTVSPQGYRLIVPDVETQQVGALVTVKEQATSSAAGAPLEPEAVGVALRLRIDAAGKIAEIEQIAARPDRPLGGGQAAAGVFGRTGEMVEAMERPWEGYARAVPAAERMSRADLVAVANAYFEAIERNDGKGYYPFTDDCLRYENGIIAAAPRARRSARSGRGSAAASSSKRR